jgi:hypothetical protein
MYVLTLFLVFCTLSDGEYECFDKQIVLTQTVMNDFNVCEAEAKDTALTFVEEEVIFVNIKNGSLFLPGAKCEARP